MPATFDAVIRIPQRLAALSCPASAFAVIYGKRSAAYLSKIFQGNARLHGDEALEMLALLDELEALRDAFPQIPIDFSNGLGIRRALELRRDGAEDHFISYELSELRAGL